MRHEKIVALDGFDITKKYFAELRRKYLQRRKAGAKDGSVSLQVEKAMSEIEAAWEVDAKLLRNCQEKISGAGDFF